jgi:hypothetical protein
VVLEASGSVTYRRNDPLSASKAVEWAIAAKELGYPKQTDGKRLVKEWRAAQKA